jgi:protein-disulfide isomerase
MSVLSIAFKITAAAIVTASVFADPPPPPPDAPQAIAAVVNGRAIPLDVVDAPIAEKLRALEQQIHVLRKASADSAVIRAVLEEEAIRRGISIDELKTRLSGDVPAIADSEVDRLYASNVAIFGSLSADEARQRIRFDLQTQRRMETYRHGVEKLVAAANVEWFLADPVSRPAAQNASLPSRGRREAPITITEFADFGCGHCREVQPALKELLRLYPDDVRIVFRHMPLLSDKTSVKAARTAACAAEQGRFWEFHDALFDAHAASDAAIASAAVAAKLDAAVLDQCTSSNTSMLTVLGDLDEARRLSIDGTPTFLVNGVVMSGAADLPTLNRAVANELKAAETRSAVPVNAKKELR